MIGKIVLTMLVAAAKINQSSIVPAFDQTGVPRIIQVPSGAELELELIQTQMAQKPMLRAEVGMRVRCANKASAE